MNISKNTTSLISRIERALELLEQWDTTYDYQDSKNRAVELALVEAYAEFVKEAHLTPAGLNRIEERIGFVEDFIRDNEVTNGTEE